MRSACAGVRLLENKRIFGGVDMIKWKKPPFPDETLRRILDAHFLTPDSELEKEYRKATRQAEMLFKEHTKKPFVVA